MSDSMTTAVAHYLHHQAPNVDGWLHVVSQFMICNIDYLQKKADISGDIAEIGMWEAKTSVLFSLLSEDRNMVHDIDIEIRQAARNNLASFGYKGGSNVSLTECSSTDITIDDLHTMAPSKFRLFHVDGYHTFDVAKSDLALAFATTRETGVIALDDFYASTLPGVTEALYEAVFTGRNYGFFPFALGGAKVYLCRENMVDWYREGVMELMRPMQSRTTEHTKDVSRMFGRVVAIYDLW